MLASTIAAFFALTAGQAIAATLIEVDPGAVDFGKRTIGEEYSIRDLVVSGTEAAAVQVTGASLIGPDPDQFVLENVDCDGSDVDQASYCFYKVSFVPTTVGDKSASVEIETLSGDPLSVPLSGSAREPVGNAPDLAAPSLNPALTDTRDLWGFAGGDFEGLGRSGVISISQMADWSVTSSFAFGGEDGLLGAPIGRGLAGGGFAGDAAVGDFDGDGSLDAVGAGGGTAFAYLNQGGGVMSAGTELPVDDVNGIDGRLAAGDFNEDGFDDILAGYGTYDDATDTYGYMLQIFAGSEDGSFASPVSQQTAIDNPMSIASGDFNGDGVSDFAASDFAGLVYMFTGDGDGTFTQADVFGGGSCGCASPWGAATGDLNGDGLDDVVVAMRFEDQLRTYLAREDGSFERGESIEVPYSEGWNPNPYSVSVGDLNGDSKPDVISGNYMNDSVSVFVGNGDGRLDFAENLIPDPGNFFAPHGTFIGDFNGDGKPDPSAASQNGPVAIFLNQGEPGQVPSPTALDFGGQTDGTESAPKTVTLSNADGLASLRVSLVEIAGGDSNDFKIKGGDCLEGPIPVGGSCQAQVAFTPVGPAGDRGSALDFATNNSAEGLISVPLAGQSLDPTPGLSIDPAGLSFGNVELGKESAGQAITVTSTGTSRLEISAVSIEGSGMADFEQVSNGCIGSFEVGASCQISYRFKPRTVGAASATIRLTTNLAGDPAGVGLSGNGTPAPVVTPPRVIVTKRPKAVIRIRARKLKQVRVAFRADQAGARFQCRIDRRKFSRCKSPKIFRNVKPGRHQIRIRAVKAGKNSPVKVIRFRVIRRR